MFETWRAEFRPPYVNGTSTPYQVPEINEQGTFTKPFVSGDAHMTYAVTPRFSVDAGLAALVIMGLGDAVAKPEPFYAGDCPTAPGNICQGLATYPQERKVAKPFELTSLKRLVAELVLAARRSG